MYTKPFSDLSIARVHKRLGDLVGGGPRKSSILGPLLYKPTFASLGSSDPFTISGVLLRATEFLAGPSQL